MRGGEGGRGRGGKVEHCTAVDMLEREIVDILEHYVPPKKHDLEKLAAVVS